MKFNAISSLIKHWNFVFGIVAAEGKALREKVKRMSIKAVAQVDRVIYQAMDRSFQAHDRLKERIAERKQMEKFKNEQEKMDWEWNRKSIECQKNETSNSKCVYDCKRMTIKNI